MISYVAKLINVFILTVQNILFIASLIGQLIVTTVTLVVTAICNVFKCIIVFFNIVYEDNISTLSEELSNLSDNIIEVISKEFNSLQNGLCLVHNEIYLKIVAVFEGINFMIDSVTVFICEITTLFKTILIFWGNTIWFIITFIPVHLPQLLKALFTAVSEVIIDNVIDAYMALLKVTNFLTDVPLESFIGIISTIVIVRLSIHFRDNIVSQVVNFYWGLVRKLLYLYHALYNYFNDSDVRVITRMASGQVIETRSISLPPPEDEDTANATDALCVICQERQKCVLTLPCRHICLCTECCRRLYGYQRTCPICRTFIYHSVTVYL